MRDIPARMGRQTDSARELIERAQRILTFEQRSGHQDTAVRPGGIEAFIERWSSQMLDARNRGEIAAPPAGASGRFPEVAILHLLTGYRALDPMQRAAKIRAALALLDALETPDAPEPSSSAGKPSPTPAARPPTQAAPRFGQPARPANGRPASRAPSSAPEDDWPLAKPLPKPPVLPAQRPRSAEPPREPRPED